MLSNRITDNVDDMPSNRITNNVSNFFLSVIKFSSYQALFIFVGFLISLCFNNNYYDFIIYFIYIYCGVIFMYGFLYTLKYINIQAKNDKLVGLDKIIDFQKNNTAGFKIRLLSIVNILVHLLPLMLLLFVIFKLKNSIFAKKIIKTKYPRIFTITLVLILFIINNVNNSTFLIYNHIWNITFKDYIEMLTIVCISFFICFKFI